MNSTDTGIYSEAGFTHWQTLAFVAVASFGILTNALSANRIRQSFDIGRNVFMLIHLEAITCSVTSAIAAAVLLAFLIFPESNNYFTCSTFFMAILVPWICAPAIAAEIAAIRFVGLRMAISNVQMKEDKIRWALILLVVLPISYFLVLPVWWYRKHYHERGSPKPYAVNVGLCMGGDSAVDTDAEANLSCRWPIVGTAFIFTLFSVVFHILIVIDIVRGREKSLARNSRKKYCLIPVRATVFSTLTVIPYFIIAFVLSFGIIPVSKGTTIIVLSGLTMNAVRNPMTIMLTFAIRDQRTASEGAGVTSAAETNNPTEGVS